MDTKIYYFSATGNSLSIAKQLEEKIDNSRILSIAKEVQKDTIEIDSDAIGIVFPVYCMEVPYIVEEFLKKLKFKKKPYIFSIATNNEVPGYALGIVDKLLGLNDMKLDAGYTLVMPGTSVLIADFTNPEDERKRRLDNAKTRLKSIAREINQKKSGSMEGIFSIKTKLIGKLFKTILFKIYKAHKKFYTEEKCNFCGTCSKVCPRKNIIVNSESKKVLWGKKCEACLACFHLCPQKSVSLNKKSKDKLRYMNPDVELGELITR